ncbi:MAG: iron ABC transporter substrate-binding protein [Anaerolineae bacterium]|nr:iron ABC transporter substrate-binding protein [Anaerolineae bacterium]MDW8098421.1 iron ABC transporter substrate-binding protein [Anaerolineae bacterium]
MRIQIITRRWTLTLGLGLALLLTACVVPVVTTPASSSPQPTVTEVRPTPATAATSQKLVLYSGRSENLVGPIVAQFQEATGIQVEARWGSTAELAATLLEEGERSPADVFFAQDPGGLGAVAKMMTVLPEDILNRVDPRFRDPQGRWVGLSGRARVIVYNTERVNPSELPADIWDFTDPKWKGRIGWAPTNASFQTMVTAMRVVWGEEKTRQWLEGILANEPRTYENNSAIVAAVGAGEVDVGFANHYYLYRFLREQGEGFPARNYFLPGGGPGSLVMVAGAGVLESSTNKETAFKFLRFMLSPVAQQYFATQTFEYPLVEGVSTHPDLPPLGELHAIQIDLADLADLEGTIRLLREVGALP